MYENGYTVYIYIQRAHQIFCEEQYDQLYRPNQNIRQNQKWEYCKWI